MKNFEGKVAVVTGAASGIGLGLAERCVDEGMKVVIADVEADALEAARCSLIDRGGEVLALATDVSQQSDIERLADETLRHFGGVHLLFNNAGVGAGGVIWECSIKDWEWTLGVNLWGVIYAVHKFVPIMLAQATECHIVNTASIEGLWARPGHAPYQVSKHGVVNLSEVLWQDLQFANAKIGVSVLCPGAVDTNIIDSWRNRPVHLRNDAATRTVPDPNQGKRIQALRDSFRNGMTRAECAAVVFDAIRQDQLYILTHPQLTPYVEDRLGNVIAGRNPDLQRVPMRPQNRPAD
ncbi:MAG: SDR family NAD(P)-dependent oxidoreductase [Pseudomonadota bacterium]